MIGYWQLTPKQRKRIPEAELEFYINQSLLNDETKCLIERLMETNEKLLEVRRKENATRSLGTGLVIRRFIDAMCIELRKEYEKLSDEIYKDWKSL